MTTETDVDPEADAAAAEAQRDWWQLEEQYPEACALATYYIHKWLYNKPRGVGYRRLAKIMAGKGEFADTL